MKFVPAFASQSQGLCQQATQGPARPPGLCGNSEEVPVLLGKNVTRTGRKVWPAESTPPPAGTTCTPTSDAMQAMVLVSSGLGLSLRPRGEGYRHCVAEEKAPCWESGELAALTLPPTSHGAGTQSRGALACSLLRDRRKRFSQPPVSPSGFSLISHNCTPPAQTPAQLTVTSRVAGSAPGCHLLCVPCVESPC